MADAIFLGVVYSRPGLLAALLWYVAPLSLIIASAVLLAAALIRSWRHSEVPTVRHLAALATLALVVGSLAVFRTYPSSYDDHPSQVPFRLPLDGPLTVAWGGPTLGVNYHAVMPDQRWAYDLLLTVDGQSHRGSGSLLEDYYVYGAPLLATADGVVRVARTDQADAGIGQRQVLRAAGNYLVLEVADREFLFIAHLQQGSISVNPGDRVSAGQVIGRVGNSGNSSEPHVHLHLQDSPETYLGEGIPFYFHRYRTRGELVARGMPTGGRSRRSLKFPGAFHGQIVEHVGVGASSGAFGGPRRAVSRRAAHRAAVEPFPWSVR